MGRLLYVFRAFRHKFWDIFDLYVLCLNRKEIFMRKWGMCVGEGCDLITDVINFGSEPYMIQIGNNVTITSGVKFINHDVSTRLFPLSVTKLGDYTTMQP